MLDYHRYGKIIGLLIVGFFLSLKGNSQADTTYLKIIPLDTTHQFIEKNINIKSIYYSKNQVQKTLQTTVLDLQKQAYLTASFDSIQIQGDTTTAYLFLGYQYQLAKLTNGNVEPAFLEQVGFKEKLYASQIFDYQNIVQIQEALLTYAENHGYPFASVYLGDIVIENGNISAKLYMDKNRLITLKPIQLEESTAKIGLKYLENYLDLREGDLYSETKIRAIQQRLRELRFLKEKQPAQVVFEGNKATIYLFLEKQRSSKFDFLVGFLPQNEETGGLTFTGNIQLYFQNLLGRGELIDFHWQQLRPSTPQLDIHLTYNYLLNLPFGADAKFHLYRRDSSYLDVRYDLGIQYLFEGGNYLKAFVNNTSTTLLTVNPNQIINSRQLPRNLDVSNTTLGLEYYLQRLNYRYNPQKGFEVLFRGGAGLKRIDKNTLITDLEDPDDTEFDFTTLYDILTLNTYQFKIDATLNTYIPLGQRGTLKIGVTGGGLITQDSIYQNELYRIGGNRLLRGFDEESVFTDLYGVGTLEARFLTGLNSYLFAFLDYAWLNNRTTAEEIQDQPFGFGLGLTLQLGNGILSFSVAAGQQLNNPLDFQSTKIHVGYVSYF